MTCLYSLLTALGSLRLIWGSASTARTLFILLLLDVVSAWLIITTTSLTAYDLLNIYMT